MEAKKKAQDLIDKFDYPNIPTGLMSVERKQCALICINEQIDYIENEMIGFDYNIRKVYIEELNEIKQEIEKL